VSGCCSGVNGSVTLGDGLTQREGILGDGSHPVGSRGEDPTGGLVDEPPKLILILEMGVKLIFYGEEIDSAYMSRFLKRTHAAVLAVQLTIHIGRMLI